MSYKLHFNAVRKAYKKCAYPINKPLKKDAIKIESISGLNYLDRKGLEQLRADVLEMLKELRQTEDSFKFHDIGFRHDGSIWAGDGATKEMLLIMSIGLGYGRITLPREMWSTFPGGLPYIEFKLN